MLTPSSLLVSKLEKLEQNARARRNERAEAVYRAAKLEAPKHFTNRGFGEAVAVATKAFQRHASETRLEDERMAWLRSVDEIQQVVNELS